MAGKPSCHLIRGAVLQNRLNVKTSQNVWDSEVCMMCFMFFPYKYTGMKYDSLMVLYLSRYYLLDVFYFNLKV